MRFAHRTLSLHATLPDVPLRDKQKLGHDCEEAVKFVRFLWKEKEKSAKIQRLHRVEVSFARNTGETSVALKRLPERSLQFREAANHHIRRESQFLLAACGTAEAMP